MHGTNASAFSALTRSHLSRGRVRARSRSKPIATNVPQGGSSNASGDAPQSLRSNSGARQPRQAARSVVDSAKAEGFFRQARLARMAKGRPRTSGYLHPRRDGFGTGEHATTATCLRLLADLTRKFLEPGFAALESWDRGGDSCHRREGLRRSKVEAIDYDPVAVRIARQKRHRRIPSVEFSRGDVLLLAIGESFRRRSRESLRRRPYRGRSSYRSRHKARGLADLLRRLARAGSESCRRFPAARLSQARIVMRGKWCAGICQKDRRQAVRATDLEFVQIVGAKNMFNDLRISRRYVF